MISRIMADTVRNRRKLLVVEDDPGLHKQLKWCFPDYDVVISADRQDAISALRKHKPPVVTLDLGLPPDPSNASEGIAALEEILSIAPNTKVIVVTGNDEQENALNAIRLGAYDFYQKPIDSDVLGLIVERAFKLYDIEQENRRLASQQTDNNLFGFVGSSPQINNVCRTITKIAPTDATALLLGESGTGKEMLARALHYLSERKENPFIAINCAAIPESLLETELFGHEKGAFTGAQKQTRGKIQYADKGTLFLDEVGDLPQSLQGKLLRFLQERVIERVGGREEIAVDVRIICATHQDLAQKMQEGLFREDLYYRISEISIKIPPLRERAGDAVILAKYFLNLFGQEEGRKVRFSDSAIAAIEHYEWPGNARELENKVKRAIIMTDSGVIEPSDLELISDINNQSLNLRVVRENAERDAIMKAIQRCNGKISHAAEVLGVSRPTLYDLLEKYDLKT